MYLFVQASWWSVILNGSDAELYQFGFQPAALRAPQTHQVLVRRTCVRHIAGDMKTIHAVFQNDGEWFVARCLDLPVTTQGKTLVAAKKNLQEAVELYFETWGESKKFRPAREVYLTSLEVAA
jgi:predicted RNase H-like HicB family nuclease